MNDNNMQKRTLIALVISIAFLVVFQYVFMNNNQNNITTNSTKQEAVEKKRDETVSNSKTPTETDKKGNTGSKKILIDKNLPESTEIQRTLNQTSEETAKFKYFDNKIYKIKINLKGGTIEEWIEKEHEISILNNSSLSLFYNDLNDKNIFYNFEKFRNGFKLTSKNTNLKIEKIITFKENNPYIAKINIISAIPFDSLKIAKRKLEKGMQKRYDKYFYYDTEDKFEDDKITEDESKTIKSNSFIGFDSQYFVASFLSDGQEISAKLKNTKDNEIEIYYNLTNDPVSLFYGPKKLDLLEKVNPELENTVHFRGFLSPISKFLLEILNFIFGIVKNYGLAIIVLTILIKLILYPLTHKSLTSMAKMKEIQPEMQKLRKKYKDEPQKLNKKMMELYKENDVNPAGGCLPMLLQFPILIALFSVFSNAIALKGKPFILWITDLSSPDVLFNLPFEVPIFGWETFNVLPILMIITMVYQQKANSGSAQGQGGTQMIMKFFLPAFMFFIFYNFPSGLVLYFLSSNIITLVQQKYIMKHLENQEE